MVYPRTACVNIQQGRARGNSFLILLSAQVDYADLSDNEIVSMQGLEVPRVVAGKVAACRAVCQGVALLKFECGGRSFSPSRILISPTT